MKINIVQIGNSRGIRIPKALLEQCGFKDSAELEVSDNRLVLSPGRKPREGWEEACAAMAACGDDKLLDGEISDDFDTTDWEW